MLKPLISEKSIARTAEDKFTFIITSKLSKVAISKMIKKFFNVTPVAVNTITRKGKVKRTGKVYGKRKDQTIAIVTLKKGEKIPGFEFPADQKEIKAKKTDKVVKDTSNKIDTDKEAKKVNPIKKAILTRTHKESK